MKMMFKIFSLSTLFIGNIWAYNPIPGTIPLDYGHYPATDLVCDNDDCGPGIQRGDILLPEQAEALYFQRKDATGGQWNLGDLNPSESYIWKNQKFDSYNKIDEELDVNDLDTVDYVSKGWARLGSMRLTVNKSNKYGVPTQYTVMISKTIHNFLLRKALLRKLGYHIPAIKYVPRIRVNFPNKKEKEDFLSQININNAGSYDRWILSQTDKSVVVQDLIVMEDQEFHLNLAKGYLSEDIFQGKRIYDSLLVPFALTEVPESINLFEWTVGRIYSDNVYLKFPFAREYDCSHGDGLWATKRILALTEKDWKEIVEETKLPPSVQVLLLEKLKSRRNHLGYLFGIGNFNLPVNSQISNHDDLVEGQVTKEFYEGYARRFRIPDPESPLSYSEMVSFFKSKAITTGMELLVNAINSQDFMGTDITSKISDFNEKILAEAVADNIISGNTNKLPIKTFAFPTVGGNLIVNREIVAGSYLGTDNMIQLVDTVGASVYAGVFGGLTGVYTKTGGLYVTPEKDVARQFSPVNLSANAQVYLNRTYAHVKPITSVQKALKYPFKNLFIPTLKKKYGKVFNALHNEDFELLDSKSQENEMNEMIKLLDENLERGESMIVTDSIGAGITASAGVNLYNVARVDLNVKPNTYVVSRLHILRTSDDEIHIYKDLGNINSIEVAVGVSKYVPILKLTIKGSQGYGQSKFYKVNMAKAPNNVERADNLRALRSVMLTGSMKSLDRVQSPYVVKHKFTEANRKLGIFVLRWNRLNTSDNITVIAPNGSEKHLYRRNKGKTNGVDYENYAKDLVDLLIGKIFKTNISLTSFNEGNPGYTFMGRAKNKITTYETELNKETFETKPMVKLSRIWNGWQVKAKKAKKILKEIKDRYGFRFHEDDVLAQTSKLFLYNINVNFFIYQDGLKHMLDLPDQSVENVWRFHQSRKMTNYTGDDALVGSGVFNFLKERRKYHEALVKNDVEEMSNRLIKVTEILEDKLKITGVELILGGKNNFFAVSKIEGFRVGDENGDKEIISSSFGRIGNEDLDGPLDRVRKFLGMTHGEFYMSWLMGRVI